MDALFDLHFPLYRDLGREARGIIRFGINLINGSAIDPMVDELLAAAIDENATETATKPKPSNCPPIGRRNG